VCLSWLSMLLVKALCGSILYSDDRGCGDYRIAFKLNRSALMLCGDTISWILLNLIHSLHILLVRVRNHDILL
jgi:hypothetical protein